MMLLHGTLSDAFGRRRIIVAGMAAYSLAALVCAGAQSFEMLLVGRVLQGISAGAGIVVGRAIVRDIYSDQAAQRALALVMIIFGVAPGLAPIIGGWLGHLFGWRAVFLFLSLLSATLLLVTLAFLPETLPRSRRTPFSARSLVAGFVAAFSSARFVLLVSAYGFDFAGFFIYTLGLGIAMPSITLLVLDLMPERRGLASSMIGFSQSGFSAVLAGAISHLVDESAHALALCSLVLMSLGLICWLSFLARVALSLRSARA